MPAKTPKEVFVTVLSDVRQGAERAAKLYQEIGQMAQDPEIKEALEARAFVSEKVLATLDQCFKLIGEQPVKLSGRIQGYLCGGFPQRAGRDPKPRRQASFHPSEGDPSHPPSNW